MRVSVSVEGRVEGGATAGGCRVEKLAANPSMLAVVLEGEEDGDEEDIL